MRPLLFTVSHATDRPERTAGQLWTICAAARTGAPVALWLSHEGVRLAVQGVAETLREPYPKSAAEMLDELVAAGCTLHTDRMAFSLRHFDPEALREGAALQDPEHLARLVAEGHIPVEC